jgi:glycosyltransferase involved in cell wall biosynthesis
MASQKPRVSIGMPIYNGANFLVPTLDALLAQTFTNFELIISDNGSTDQTETICRAYAERDSRIRYYRVAENKGASWNYNRVFELAVGEYFKWAAHDDICQPAFLERCVAALDQHPDAVVAHPRTRAIDENGAVLRDYPAKPGGASTKPYRRFFEFVCIPHPCVAVFGLIRVSALKQTSLIGNFAAADRPLLGKLALLGQFCEIPEFLFLYRNHPQQSWQAYSTRHAVQAWYDPKKRAALTFPHWRLLREHLRAITTAPLNLYDRVRCYLCMGWWLRVNWRHLAKNLILQEA